MGRTISLIVVACGLSLAEPAAAQNLLVNGDFATDLGGWQFPDSTPTWSSFDIGSSPSSGSAYAINDQASAGTQLVVLTQCVVLTEPGAYLVGAHGYAATGQASGHLVAGFDLDLNHADCSGPFSGLGGDYIATTGQWEAYHSPTLTISAPPPALMSIAVWTRVDKSDAGGTFAGYFDALSLVRDTVFIDGFD